MARRKTRRRRAVAVNPRRRRRHVRRRRNPVVARTIKRRTVYRTNPRRRRRRFGRRRNPSAAGLGNILRNMVYGAGGAIGARVGYSLVSGFVPGSLGASQFARPAIKAALGATVVKWIGKKFFGPAQGEMMALGSYIDAGVDLVQAFLPNIEGQVTGILHAPVQAAQLPAGDTVSGFSDVEDVPIGAPAFAGLGGFGDVEEVSPVEFGAFF